MFAYEINFDKIFNYLNNNFYAKIVDTLEYLYILREHLSHWSMK